MPSIESREACALALAFATESTQIYQAEIFLAERRKRQATLAIKSSEAVISMAERQKREATRFLKSNEISVQLARQKANQAANDMKRFRDMARKGVVIVNTSRRYIRSSAAASGSRQHLVS